MRRFGSDHGSAPAEFAMVAALLTVLTLSVIQLALALHIRNTVADAAAEGARYGALADNDLADGAARTRDLITTAIGGRYARHVSASYGTFAGHPSSEISVDAPLPVIGLIGFPDALHLHGHAALESIGD